MSRTSVFRTSSFRLAAIYLALFTAMPSDSGGGTEVSGGSYARVAITNNATNVGMSISMAGVWKVYI